MQIVYNPFINILFNIMENVYKDITAVRDKIKRILYIKKSKNK